MDRKPVVLIADDDKHFRGVMRTRLGALGFDTVECSDGLSVLAECPKGWVAAALLDHDMPNGDGRSLARVIRNESNVPIIFLSGHDREEFRSIVAELPDLYYLSKPVDFVKLEALLDSIIHVKLAGQRRREWVNDGVGVGQLTSRRVLSRGNATAATDDCEEQPTGHFIKTEAAYRLMQHHLHRRARGRSR